MRADRKLKDAIQKVSAATGVEDIETMIDAFAQAEDSNFTLFNYVSELAGVIEHLEDSIVQIKADIRKYKGQDKSPGLGDQAANTKRRKILADLDETLSQTKTKTELYQSKLASVCEAELLPRC